MDDSDQNAPDQLRSHLSEDRAYIRFLNLTNRTVEIVWINFNGQFVRYRLLKRHESVNINTFKTHPWVAIDVATKDRMLCDLQYVYMPTTFKDYLLRSTRIIRPVVPEEKRKVVCVTLPLYSLRYRTLQTVRDFFKTAEETDGLDLPKPLLNELKRMIQLKNHRLVPNQT